MHRSRLVLLLVSLVLVLAACGGGGADATDPASEPADTPSPTAEATQSAAATESAEPTESAAATDGASEENEVVLGDMSFSPGELTVAVDTTVTFTNNSGFPHTVTNGTGGRPAEGAAFDEAIAANGGTVEITFDEAGTFDITCKLHPSMQMRVVVEG